MFERLLQEVCLCLADLQHHLCLLTFDNKLGLCPPNLPDSNVKRVLDLGTGTGIWAIDFGDEHPEAEVSSMDLRRSQTNGAQVVGVDLSPSQPNMYAWKPVGWDGIADIPLGSLQMCNSSSMILTRTGPTPSPLTTSTAE